MSVLYEFECDKCGERQELFLKLEERNRAWEHVDCGGQMKRSFSVVPIHFNAPGFTKTPAIAKDPISKGHPIRDANYGTLSSSEFASGSDE